MAEDKFEKALIKKLEAEGWTYRKDLSGVSTIKIEEHWKEVLNELNAHKLNGVELSDIEFGLMALCQIGLMSRIYKMINLRLLSDLSSFLVI